jgi:hypothetical protein
VVETGVVGISVEETSVGEISNPHCLMTSLPLRARISPGRLLPGQMESSAALRRGRNR